MRGGWGAGAARRDDFPGLNGDGSQGGSPGRIHETNRVSIRPAWGPLAKAEPGPRANGTAPRSRARWPRALQRPGAGWKTFPGRGLRGNTSRHRSSGREPSPLPPLSLPGARSPTGDARAWPVHRCRILGHVCACRDRGREGWQRSGYPGPHWYPVPVSPHPRSPAGGRRYGRSGRRGCSGSVLFCRRGRLRRYSGAGGAGGVPVGRQDRRPFPSGTRLLQAQKGRAPRLPVEQRARSPRENRVPAWGDSPRENERLHFFFVRGEKLGKKIQASPTFAKAAVSSFPRRRGSKVQTGFKFQSPLPVQWSAGPPRPRRPGQPRGVTCGARPVGRGARPGAVRAEVNLPRDAGRWRSAPRRARGWGWGSAGGYGRGSLSAG